MNIHIHVHHDRDDAVATQLNRIEQLLIEQGKQMSVDTAKLEAALTAESDAETAVENLLVTLTTEIKAISVASTDTATQSKLDALTSDVENRTAALSAAVVANTPATS